MIRHVARVERISYLPPQLPPCLRHYSARRGAGSDADEADITTARQWLARLDPDTIPRSICDISFSRSSGPGGQNVNKFVWPAPLPTFLMLIV